MVKQKLTEDWVHPKIVSNALELLEKEIPKYREKIDFVHMSFTTDPFMFNPMSNQVFPAFKDLSLKIIKRLNKENIKVTVLTKGLFPQELTSKEFNRDNEYGITLISLDEKFRKNFEPFTAPYETRIQSLEYLHNNGLKTWVSMEPYPTPNLVKQDISKIIERIAFVDKIIFGKMHYNPAVTKFPEAEAFYTDCSRKVIDFCEKKGKHFHIKKGTPNADITTKELFRTD